MIQRIIISRTLHGTRLVLPADLEFHDYRELLTIVERIGATQGLQLDLSRLDVLPTWLLGFLLHVEERLALRLEVVGAASTLQEVFTITNTRHFLRPDVQWNSTATGALVDGAKVTP